MMLKQRKIIFTVLTLHLLFYLFIILKKTTRKVVAPRDFFAETIFSFLKIPTAKALNIEQTSTKRHLK